MLMIFLKLMVYRYLKKVNMLHLKIMKEKQTQHL